MDEQEFRSTYHAVNARRCVFEKAILSRRSHCSQCTRFNLADREGASCGSPPGLERCKALLDQLRQNAIFALKLTHLDGELPHGKEIKVQNGGLLGLQRLMLPGQEPEAVEDIAGLINNALLRFGDLDALPYNEIIQSVASFEGRKKRPRKR